MELLTAAAAQQEIACERIVCSDSEVDCEKL